MIVTNPPSPQSQHQIRRSDGSPIKRGSSSYLRSLRTAKIALVFYSVLSITCLQLGSLFTSQQRRFLSRFIGRNNADEYNMITPPPPPACESMSSITRLLLGPSSPMCKDRTTKRDDTKEAPQLTTTTHYSSPPSSPVSDPQPTRHVDSSPVTHPADGQGNITSNATSKSKVRKNVPPIVFHFLTSHFSYHHASSLFLMPPSSDTTTTNEQQQHQKEPLGWIVHARLYFRPQRQSSLG